MTDSIRDDYNKDLIDAAVDNDETVVRIALQSGANIDAQDSAGLTALHHAIRNRDLDMVKLLLSENADPNIPDDHGDTALFLSAGYGLVDITKELLSANADPDMLNNHNSTALSRAAQHDHAACCELLLEKMTRSIDHQDSSGTTAVMNATLSGRIRALGALLEHNPDLEKTDNSNRNVLQLASQFDMLDAYTYIVDHKKGVAVRIEEQERRTAAQNAKTEQAQQRSDRQKMLRRYTRSARRF